ncbi:MAG: YggT family protein [Acidobacteria bacterium]|nr:YggT family protein [Acidobacteriota bacterium]
MLLQIYPFIQQIVVIALLIFVAALVVRLIFNFSDPNPFGKVGRFSSALKKLTDRFVYPAATLLARFRVNTRYAPLVTIFMAAVLAYFSLQIIHNTFFVVDGLTESARTGNVRALIGFLLYGAISLFILFIFIRFVSTWFVFTRSTFLGFVRRVTDPVLLPVQRLIPPIGMFDISAMLILLALGFLKNIVLQTFVY